MHSTDYRSGKHHEHLKTQVEQQDNMMVEHQDKTSQGSQDKTKVYKKIQGLYEEK